MINDTRLPPMTAERSYDKMLELFENPEPSQAWVDEFNDAATAMECRRDDGIDDGLPTTNHVLQWYAWLEHNKPYIASPPIVLKDASIRLTLDVMNPLHDKHINVHAIPYNEKGEPLDKQSDANRACIIIDPGAGPGLIFAGWDFIAREGIDAGLKCGAITRSWVQVITSKVPCLDLGTVEEQHAIKMLKVYADDNDLEHAIVEYRKVNAAKSYSCMAAAVKYNKLRFYLGLIDEKIAKDRAAYGDIEGSETLEMEQVRRRQESMKPKAFKRWLLDGEQITYESVCREFKEAQDKIYKNRKLVLLAIDARNAAKRSIINAIKPGDGIPVALVPEEFAFSEFTSIQKDESTNRTAAIRDALPRLGRKSGFNGNRFLDVAGLKCAEVTTGFVMKGSGATYEKYKGLLVDLKHVKVTRYEYQSCIKDGRFGFLK